MNQNYFCYRTPQVLLMRRLGANIVTEPIPGIRVEVARDSFVFGNTMFS